MTLRFVSGVLVVLLVVPRLAWADGRDPTGAEALFLAGREAVERKDYASACPKFAESDRLDPAAGTLINLADCEEHIDRPAAAWGHWKEAIDLLEASDSRLPACKERAAAVEKRVPRLTLKLRPGSPEGTRVVRDGNEIGPAALGIAIPQEPGAHALLVTAPGHKTRETSVTLAEGEVKELVLDAGELEAVVAPPPVPPPAPPASPPSSTGKTLGVVLAGAGLAGLAVGTTTGVMALSKKSTVEENCFPVGVCNERGHDAASSGRTLAIVSTIGFSAGAALLGVGAVLYLTAPKTQAAASTTRRTTASPLFLPGGIGLVLTREL
ncbi:MAG: hypothetical protein JWM74_101 [Myxococcaceae bacterium]|nr:hypothetical protein [Myxococcaceae bacterium]